MTNRSLKLIASVLIMASPGLSNATAWPGLPGQTEFSISYENTQYDDLLTADGAVSKGWGVASHATFFGLSYDLTDAIRLGMTSGYGESSSTKPGGTTKGILDTDVHVEMNLVNPFETEGFGLGVRASYRIPGSYELQRVPHGLGKRVQAASLEVALGYSIATVVFETSLGYRLTIPGSAAAPNDIFGQSSIAWSPFEKALLALHYTFQLGQSGPDLSPDVADLVTLKEEDHTLHASLGYQVLDDLGLSLRFAKALAGRNAPDATRLGFSLTYSL